MSQYTEILTDLLQARRAEPAETERFKRWKHDDICERFRQQVDAVFSAFGKYNRVVYDIQGLKDEGTDVLLSERVDTKKEFTCFQIKAEWDLSQADHLKILKAQHFDSERLYGDALKDYYIVLCWSIAAKDKAQKRLTLDKSRKEKVKNVIRQFELVPKTRIIEPEFAIAFLSLNSIQIDVLIRSRFGNEDIVFKEAINLVGRLSPTETTVLIFLIWLELYSDKSTVTADEVLHSDFIQRTFPGLPDKTQDLYFENDTDNEEYVDEDEQEYYKYGFERRLDTDSQVVRDLERLEGDFLERTGDDKFHVSLQSVQPLVVLMMDGYLRYDYSGEELLRYMLTLLGVVEGDSVEE